MNKKKISHFLSTMLLFIFLLGIHDGKVALWQEDDPEPVKIFPYRASLLPDEAQEQLRKGIRIESMEDLDRLIEAYLS